MSKILQLPFGLQMSAPDLLMWMGGIIFLVSFFAHVVQRGADKKSATGQAKETETEHERKASSVADKTAQSAENAPTQTVESNGLSTMAEETETLKPNKVKGDAFEDYVISKFKMLTESDKRNRSLNRHGRHILIEHRSDKGKSGIYPEANKLPDLEIGLFLGKNEHPHKFAIECKYHRDVSRDKVTVCSSEQLARYQKYEQEKEIPTFIVVGAGGYSDAPDSIYIIPLHRFIESDINEVTGDVELTAERLALHHQSGKRAHFYYDYREKALSY